MLQGWRGAYHNLSSVGLQGGFWVQGSNWSLLHPVQAGGGTTVWLNKMTVALSIDELICQEQAEGIIGGFEFNWFQNRALPSRDFSADHPLVSIEPSLGWFLPLGLLQSFCSFGWLCLKGKDFIRLPVPYPVSNNTLLVSTAHL